MAALKGLQSLVPNGNNLPFQCNWSNNKHDKSRTFKQAKNFLLTELGKSVKLSTSKYVGFKANFPTYLETIGSL